MRKIIEVLHDPSLPYISFRSLRKKPYIMYLYLSIKFQFSPSKKKKKSSLLGDCIIGGGISLIVLNMGYRRTQSKKEEAAEERYSF